MDPASDTVYGPYTINKQLGTVTVPRELLQEVGIDRGHRVQWFLNPDIPGTLVLAPAALFEKAMPEITALLKKHGRRTKRQSR